MLFWKQRNCFNIRSGPYIFLYSTPIYTWIALTNLEDTGADEIIFVERCVVPCIEPDLLLSVKNKTSALSHTQRASHKDTVVCDMLFLKFGVPVDQVWWAHWK